MSGVTLPLDQVEARWRWWKSRPRTEAWAERYGGRLARVEQLFQDSLEALSAERTRLEEAERREREQERRQIEAEEAAKRQRLEHQAEVDRMRIESAHQLTRRSRIAAAAMSVIALLAIASAVYAVRLWAVATHAEAVATRDEALTAASLAREKATLGIAKLSLAREVAASKAKTNAMKLAITMEGLANANLVTAEQQRTVANQQRAQALNERSQVFLQAGRQALLDGDDNDAALLLAAAYSGDPHNPVLQLLLGQALQKLSVRARSIPAHDDIITALAFNPSEEKGQIATASTDGTARLWSTSGRRIHEFRDQGDLITALAFDPSGRYLVTVGRNGTAKLHDLEGITPDSAAPPIALRDPKDQLEGHVGRINSVTFSHDGKRILTSGSDGKVKVWNAAGGQLLLAWNAATPGYAINTAQFSRDDRLIAACAADGLLGVWNSDTGKQIGSTKDSSKSPCVRLAIAPAGSSVVAGTLDGTVLVFSVAANGAWNQTSERHQRAAINAISFDSVGGRVLIASEDGTARIADPASGVTIKALPAKPGAPAALTASFDPSGYGIETTYADGSVNFWTQEGDPIEVLRAPTGAAVVADFSPDGNLLATGGDDGKVYLWPMSSSLERADFSHRGAVETIEFDRNTGRMLTASQDGTAALWRVASKPRMERVLPHLPGQAWVVSARFSEDGERIVTSGGDVVKIWNADSSGEGPLTKISTTTNKRFTQAAFLGHSHNIIVAQTNSSPADTVYNTNGWMVWSSDGKKRISHQIGYLTDIRELQLTDDGRVVLAIGASGWAFFCSTDGRSQCSTRRGISEGIRAPTGFAIGDVSGTIRIVNLKGADMNHWPGHDARVSAFALSDDGRWLAAGGIGGTPGAIWDISASGRSHVPLGGGEGEIESASFSPRDATFLLATSSDGTVKLWDRASGNLLASVSVPASRATAAAFTPDGSAVVIGAQNGGIFWWPIRGGIPDPRDVAERVLNESDHSRFSDLLVRQAYDVLRNVQRNGR